MKSFEEEAVVKEAQDELNQAAREKADQQVEQARLKVRLKERIRLGVAARRVQASAEFPRAMAAKKAYLEAAKQEAFSPETPDDKRLRLTWVCQGFQDALDWWKKVELAGETALRSLSEMGGADKGTKEED